MYQNFIGIDISKRTFAVGYHGEHIVKNYTNLPQGFKDFLKDFKHLLKNGLVILETTGGYEMELIRFLQKHQCVGSRVKPHRL